MTQPLSGAAGAGANASAAEPVWEPSAGPADDATLELAASQPGEDPGPAMAPVDDVGAAQAAPTAASAAPATPVPRVRRSRSVPVLLSLAALVAVAGIGFAVGRVSAPGQTTAAGGQNGQLRPNASGFPGEFGVNLPGGAGGAGFGGSATVTGTVVSVSDSSMTLRLANGQTVQIALGSSTTYHSQTSATSSDVATGDSVLVQVSGGGDDGPNAVASASAGAGTRTATDVTVTSP